MNSGNMAERELSLVDLFWKIVMEWRRWILLGLLFALIVPCLMYAKDKISEQNALELIEEEEKEKEEEEAFLAGLTEEELLEELGLNKSELESIYYAVQVHEFLNNTREYMESSVLMAMDPYHVPTLTLQFYIDSDYTFNYTKENKPDYTSNVADAYGRYVTSGKLADAIISQLNLDLDTFYVGEMLSYERSGNFLYIKIICDDMDQLDRMAEVAKEKLAEQTSWISDEIGSHTLKLISNNTIIRMDSSIISSRTNYQNTLVNYKNQFDSMKAAMSEEQQTWLEYILAMEEEEEEEEKEEEEDVTSFVVKYAALGLVLGVFLACAWSLCEVLFTAKLQNAKDLPELYGVRLLGEISVSVRKKRLFQGIDDKILRAKNRNHKQLTVEQQLKMICSSLEISCKKSGITRVYLTGSEIEKLDPSLLKKITEGVSIEGIVLKEGSSVNYDDKSLRAMADRGYVVFVEKTGLSLLQEIGQEIRIASENGVSILGAVVLV